MTVLRALSLIAGLHAACGHPTRVWDAVIGMEEILKLRPMPREWS